jgi:4-nitrophenyl phosphatase
MRRYPLYIFDLDGTLYRGSEVIPGAAETLAKLRQSGSLVRFLTNNSSQTPQAQAAKLTAMGIQASPDEITTSGMGAANYLANGGLRKAFVVGEPGLIEVLAARGIHSIDMEETECNAVVVGICRTFTYDLLNHAMQWILRGAPFIATNPDSSYPLEGGRLIPGAGSIVASVQTASGAEPVMIGKPNPYLVQMILESAGVAPSEALVVGDRYETDILSGQAAGCDTLMVLTGVTRNAPADQAFAPDVTCLTNESTPT